MDWKTLLAPRVERGAKLLDEHNPGWAATIAMDRLAMESCNRCILGQLYGNYFRGCIQLNSDDPRTFRSSGDFGFTLKDEEQNGPDLLEVMVGFADLSDLWRAAVRGRLEATP